MASSNRPDRITIDAYADADLPTSRLGGRNMMNLGYTSGMYNRFTNRLRQPILGAKSVQLLSANIVNTPLQLNDLSHLLFFYYSADDSNGMINPSNLHCIRLHPSNFVPKTGFTNFVKNRYFTSVPELVSALNLAASSSGDAILYNPLFAPGELSFSYSQDTRKISITALTSKYIAPACADDPIVQGYLRLLTMTTDIRMNAFTSGGTYDSATPQPFSLDVIMNSRLGFTYGYNTRQQYFSNYVGRISQVGCNTLTGVPFNNVAPSSIEGDGFPILLGSQNLGVYCSISQGGGYDQTGNTNLIGNIPITTAPLSINEYTLSSVKAECLSTPNEIYEITIELRDEYGVPFAQPLNYDTQVTLSVHY